MSKKLKLVGHEFKGGIVLEETDKREGGSIVYLCKCKNCNNNKWELSARRIKFDEPISCGCLNNKSIGSSKHGMTYREDGKKNRFYNIWCKMKSRCYSPDKSYDKYKENGIKVCDRWKNSFENFKEDMYEGYLLAVEKWGEKNVSIDRIEPNGNYTPENCRWLNWIGQKHNRDYIKHARTNAIIATRMSDEYNIITVNMMMFSKFMFGTKNHHIGDVCKGKRPQEKGWKFDYITKDKYLELKNRGLDYIETPESYKVGIKHFEVKIDEYNQVRKSKEEYLQSIRKYYINKDNIIKYGVRSEIYKDLGFETLSKMVTNVDGTQSRVRKLTPKEIELYLTKKDHGIKFDFIQN